MGLPMTGDELVAIGWVTACAGSCPLYHAGVVAARIVSLDQFRGYTVLGMFVVNFLGGFAVAPALLKHHDTYCSYADTIMPQFFFAVGFAYRLTFLRRVAGSDGSGVYRRFWRRNANLMLFGAFLYLVPDAVHAMTRAHPPSLTGFLTQALRADLFQTLVHIGVTALWILPVIGARPAVRLAWACGSAGLHVILSHWFYYEWVNDVKGIDGGLLGFLTWTIPMIAGSLAYDVLAGQKVAGRAVGALLGWGAATMAFGYALSCLNLVTPPNAPAAGGIGAWLIEPPFVPPTHPVNLWTMSQRAGSVSYLTFGAGFSLSVYALFVWACDVRRWQIGIWRTLGTNALAGYVIHSVVGLGFSPVMTRRAPVGTVLVALVLYLAICYGGVRLLEKKGIHWRM
jgi:predicted acyltransferase